MDRNLIDVYESGGEKLTAAYAGLEANDLFAHAIQGTWTLHQIAVHMMDSDLIASDRMKRIASMDKPLLCGYDESAFNRLPGINSIDCAAALKIFSMNRSLTATILRHLSDEHFERFGIHTESGKKTLCEMVSGYIDHLEGHLRHIYHKRSLLGKPMPQVPMN